MKLGCFACVLHLSINNGSMSIPTSTIKFLKDRSHGAIATAIFLLVSNLLYRIQRMGSHDAIVRTLPTARNPFVAINKAQSQSVMMRGVKTGRILLTSTHNHFVIK